ncbi:hypothetical protein TNCV_3366721 [Trichonephila clavipes]|nr:hypothetical protein TNCV_3366721 [Trichonephila clavipes]
MDIIIHFLPDAIGSFLYSVPRYVALHTAIHGGPNSIPGNGDRNPFPCQMPSVVSYTLCLDMWLYIPQNPRWLKFPLRGRWQRNHQRINEGDGDFSEWTPDVEVDDPGLRKRAAKTVAE